MTYSIVIEQRTYILGALTLTVKYYVLINMKSNISYDCRGFYCFNILRKITIFQHTTTVIFTI